MTALRTLSVLSASTLLLLACGDRLTEENFRKIEAGMTQDEVVKILGEPDDKSGGGIKVGDIEASGSTWVWQEGDREISITFVNGKVKVPMKSGF